jgi:DNA modification methylase
MEINKIYTENCLDTMAKMDDNFIDLTVTSPPYDGLRTYNGYSFDFESVAKELFRITKDGGVVVWIVGDATIKGSESGTSFKQALFFKEIGFNLLDTMIWNKGTFTAVGALTSMYAPVFEYMFVVTKGKAKTFNPIKDKKNKTFGKKHHGTIRQKDGSTKPLNAIGKKINQYGQRYNIWEISPEKRNNHRLHPAMFPEQLANDHILSWSNENDLVYDPFMGSGTTAKMAILNNRNYIGSEISKDYVEIANKRLTTYLTQTKLL